jgi:hypothetical protein
VLGKEGRVFICDQQCNRAKGSWGEDIHAMVLCMLRTWHA